MLNSLDWWVLSIFSCSGCFPEVFVQVKTWLILKLHETIKAFFVVLCPIVCFPFIIKFDRSNSGQTYEHWPFWKVFGGCDLFPQDFRQVWVWIIPYLIEIIRGSDIFVCRVVFVFICGHDRQRGVLKFKKIVHF